MLRYQLMASKITVQAPAQTLKVFYQYTYIDADQGRGRAA